MTRLANDRHSVPGPRSAKTGEQVNDDVKERGPVGAGVKESHRLVAEGGVSCEATEDPNNQKQAHAVANGLTGLAQSAEDANRETPGDIDDEGSEGKRMMAADPLNKPADNPTQNRPQRSSRSNEDKLKDSLSYQSPSPLLWSVSTINACA